MKQLKNIEDLIKNSKFTKIGIKCVQKLNLWLKYLLDNRKVHKLIKKFIRLLVIIVAFLIFRAIFSQIILVLACTISTAIVAKKIENHLKAILKQINVVLAAVANSWCSMSYASDSLKNDKDIVLAAIVKNDEAFSIVNLQKIYIARYIRDIFGYYAFLNIKYNSNSAYASARNISGIVDII